MPRKRSTSKGQISLLGDILDYQLKYSPHRVITDEGSAVIVLRLPEGAQEIDRLASIQAAAMLARGVKTSANKYFYVKRVAK